MYYIGQEHEDHKDAGVGFNSVRSKRRVAALADLLRKNGVGFLAILLVTSLFNLCIHLSILRRRFVSGMNTVLVIDEISTVFRPSGKRAQHVCGGVPWFSRDRDRLRIP